MPKGGAAERLQEAIEVLTYHVTKFNEDPEYWPPTPTPTEIDYEGEFGIPPVDCQPRD